jgi:hypothetical protein
MQPHAVLDYGRPQQAILRQVRDWTRRNRRSVAIVAGLALVLYAVSYRFVRESHTKFWFDKEAEVRVPYTLFDAYSRGELCLYVAFWPACAIDRAVTGRTFEYDKW